MENLMEKKTQRIILAILGVLLLMTGIFIADKFVLAPLIGILGSCLTAYNIFKLVQSVNKK